MKRLLLVILMMSLTVSHGYAGEESIGDYSIGMSTKIGRGLWNVISSPAEIPCNMNQEMKDNPGAGFFTGFGKGMALMLRRILVGVTEVGTFVIPMGPTIPPVCHEPSPTV